MIGFLADRAVSILTAYLYRGWRGPLHDVDAPLPADAADQLADIEAEIEVFAPCYCPMAGDPGEFEHRSDCRLRDVDPDPLTDPAEKWDPKTPDPYMRPPQDYGPSWRDLMAAPEPPAPDVETASTPAPSGAGPHLRISGGEWALAGLPIGPPPAQFVTEDDVRRIVDEVLARIEDAAKALIAEIFGPRNGSARPGADNPERANDTREI
ncbi:hypothetical protein E2F47_01765 [Mycobacterium eburneum]|nr:hypothetical protein [Mycobacterium eburneum]TDH57523.1 hypothetical protein E2F47_01765 [Mycobacterium eburneum]